MPVIPHIFSSFKNVIALQTTREIPVEEQLEKSGITEKNLATLKQVHGKEIFVVRAAENNAGAQMRTEGYDAIITTEKNVFVSVKTADCTPILIYDAATNAVAAIHAGWRGTVLKIVSETLLRMKKEFGTEGKNCYAYIGACISECAFEVGKEVAEKFSEEFVRWDEIKKKHFVDLKTANKKQLEEFEIPESQIEISSHCTVVNNDAYFSYRKENGAPGRMLSVIGIKA